MVKTIVLSSGLECLVDDDDYEWLSQSKWSDDGDGYAIRRVREDRNSTEKMHRLIMKAPEHMHVDHINGKPWDNRKENLRLVNSQQNSWNRPKYSTNTSGYKGVAPYKNHKGEFKGRYTAQITFNGKKYHLGMFSCTKEAAKAYNDAALKYFGDYAQLNIVEDGLEEIS